VLSIELQQVSPRRQRCHRRAMTAVPRRTRVHLSRRTLRRQRRRNDWHRDEFGLLGPLCAGVRCAAEIRFSRNGRGGGRVGTGSRIGLLRRR